MARALCDICGPSAPRLRVARRRCAIRLPLVAQLDSAPVSYPEVGSSNLPEGSNAKGGASIGSAFLRASRRSAPVSYPPHLRSAVLAQSTLTSWAAHRFLGQPASLVQSRARPPPSRGGPAGHPRRHNTPPCWRGGLSLPREATTSHQPHKPEDRPPSEEGAWGRSPHSSKGRAGYPPKGTAGRSASSDLSLPPAERATTQYALPASDQTLPAWQ